MDRFTKIALIVAAVLTTVAAWSIAKADPENLDIRETANLTRACIPKDGHTTQLSISGTSAGSGALGARRVYSMICTTAVYWETGDAANPTADSNSDYLPADLLIYFATGTQAQSQYVAAVQVSASGTCYIHECE